MSKVQIVLNRPNIGTLLHELGAGYCYEVAQNIAAACGDGYEADTYDTGKRIVASAYTATKEAMQDNLENNTLLRNLGNG